MGLFSIRPIVNAHRESLSDESNSEHKVKFWFYILPALIAAFLVLLKIFITSSFALAVISMIAILIGFSVNAIVLLMDHVDEDMSSDEEKLVEGLRNLTLYSIIVGLVLLLLTGLSLLATTNDLFEGCWIARAIVSFLLFTGLSHYLITLFLLPARLYVVVESETT